MRQKIKTYNVEDIFAEIEDDDDSIFFGIPDDLNEYLGVKEGDVLEPHTVAGSTFYIRNKSNGNELYFEVNKKAETVDVYTTKQLKEISRLKADNKGDQDPGAVPGRSTIKRFQMDCIERTVVLDNGRTIHYTNDVSKMTLKEAQNVVDAVRQSLNDGPELGSIGAEQESLD